MADGGGPIDFVLDLDAEDFIKSGEAALAVIGKIGNPENLAGLISSLGACAEALGVVGLAVEAFKVGLDFTVEGEHLQQIENQFKTMATEAGLVPEKLRAGLEQAAGGLVTTNELLEITNKWLGELGPSASSLPQILTLSRQAVTLFGGDVKTTFDQMTQALANGNTKWLQHHGIIIDTNAAIKAFADENGIAVNALSTAAKHQAVFNAGLEAAQKRFSGVAEAMGPATTALQEFKTAWKELAETAEVLISNVLGPKFKEFFHGVGLMAKDAKQALLAAFGKGDAADTAKIDQLQSKLLQLKSHLADVEVFGKKPGFWDKLFGSTAQGDIDLTKARIQAVQHELAGLQKTKDEAAAKEEKNAEKSKEIHAASRRDALINHEAEKKDDETFAAAKLKLDEATTKEEIKQLNSVADIDKILKQQEEAREKTHADAIRKIRNDTALNDRQKDTLVAAEEKRFHAEELNRAKNELVVREQLNQQYLENSKTVFDGVGRAAHQMHDKAVADLKDFGKQGQFIMTSFQNQSIGAFQAIGVAMAQHQNIAQATALAMRNAFLGMIGDVAENYGKMLVAEGIGSFDPIPVVEGGVLIALGSALKSVAGSSGSVSTGSSGGGGAASSGAAPSQATSTTQDQTQNLQAQQQVQRTVNINIAGHYLNSQESNRTLMEIMRNETDATGFQYNKIGV
jgi:hypothetical protein